MLHAIYEVVPYRYKSACVDCMQRSVIVKGKLPDFANIHSADVISMFVKTGCFHNVE